MRIKEDSKIFQTFKLIEEGSSGESVAKQLGISRTAVWKAVEKIREYGYTIESKRRVGYRIASKPEISPFEVAKIVFNSVRDIVEEIWYFRITDSTNQRAREYGRAGVLFFAEEQMAGRGRMGRRWESRKGGLYFSITLKPVLDINDIPKLTLTTGLAVAKAVNGRIKWPNDVLIDGKKVCGILCELAGEVENPVTIVGVGINVKNEIPEDLKDRAARLIDFGDYSLLGTLKSVLESFYTHYHRLLSGEWSDLRREWIELSDCIGRKMRVVTASKTYEGVAEDIDEDGALILSGKRIYAGECFYLRG
jgi:BirA family biotin operon repressor/biotin-[acetyl-CoA-carboxylase] ligase